MKSSNITLRKSPTQPGYEPLWQGLSYQKFIRGAARVDGVYTPYIQAKTPSNHTENLTAITQVPETLRLVVQGALSMANLEKQLYTLLKSKPPVFSLDEMPVPSTALIRAWLKWFGEYDRIKGSLNLPKTALAWPPLLECFLFSSELPTVQFAPLGSRSHAQAVNALSNWSDRILHFHQQLNDSGRMTRQQDERTQYESLKARRIKKHQKRRSNLYKKLRPVLGLTPHLTAIHVAFKTAKPFTSQTKSQAIKGRHFSNGHFINAFLSLRKHQRIAQGAFKGLIGYVRKLSLVNEYAAEGGYITLLYNTERMQGTPNEVAQRLVTLLFQMSPDYTQAINPDPTPTLYMFRTNNKGSQTKTRVELISTLQYYLYDDYFFAPIAYSESDTIRDLLKDQPDLKKLRAFQAGF